MPYTLEFDAVTTNQGTYCLDEYAYSRDAYTTISGANTGDPVDGKTSFSDTNTHLVTTGTMDSSPALKFVFHTDMLDDSVAFNEFYMRLVVETKKEGVVTGTSVEVFTIRVE